MAVDTHSEAHRLKELLEPIVTSHNLFLEDVEVRVAGSHRTIHVVVDLTEEKTGGVSLEQISEISGSLSEALDTDPNDDGKPYDLEVSSPGVSRPLTEPRHWRRNIGRLIKINLLQDENLTGRLLEVGAEGITVRPELEVKKGMKPKQGEILEIPFGKIRRGLVEIEFAHLHDEAAADEEETEES